jgi:hypothetical protein
MNAKLPLTPLRNARNLTCDKETVETYNVLAISDNAIKSYVTAHIYVSRSTGYSGTVYSSIWVANHTNGHGRATGYGYHKSSAALSAAIDSAGILLDGNVDGAGVSAMTEALKAIAIAAGANPLTAVVI